MWFLEASGKSIDVVLIGVISGVTTAVILLMALVITKVIKNQEVSLNIKHWMSDILFSCTFYVCSQMNYFLVCIFEQFLFKIDVIEI